MNCQQLAQRLQQLRPDLTAIEVARLCVIMLNEASVDSAISDEQLRSLWQSASFRFDAASDQYTAVVDELDGLLSDGPVQFSPDQLWTLLRVIKVQSQLLELYSDTAALV